MTMTANVREGDMTWEQLATAALGGGVFTGLVDRVFLRRSTRADVVDKLEAISGRLAERADARMQQVEQQLAEHRRADEERERRRRARLAEHAVWDSELVEEVRRLGGNIRPAPPLD